MNKNFLYFFFILISILFFLLVFNYYISEDNKKKISLNRVNLSNIPKMNNDSIAILKNDTNNVIEFNNGYNFQGQNKVHRKFWDLLKKKNK